MKWSKLKQTIEDRFADSVKGRVELFSTVYRKHSSDMGRGWITIDKKQIADFSTAKSFWLYSRGYNETTPTNCATHPIVEDSQRTEGQLVEEGEFSRWDLYECCWEYLNLTVEQGLEHKSPIINSLAVLDKRLGKRRIVDIDKAELHPMTKLLLEFRLSAENLKQVSELKNKK